MKVMDKVSALTRTVVFSLLLVVGLISTAHGEEKEALSKEQWTDAAIQFERASDWRGLVKHATAWIESRPEDEFAWYALFVAHFRQEETSIAVNVVSRSIAMNGELFDFWMDLSNTAIEKRHHERAIAISRGILRAADSVAALKNLGYAQMRSGQPIEAAGTLREYVEHVPNDKLSFHYLGLIYDNSRQHDSAIEYFRRALEIDPAFASAWYHLGNTYYKLDGNNIRAEEAYNALRLLDSERASELAKIIRLEERRSSSRSSAAYSPSAIGPVEKTGSYSGARPIFEADHSEEGSGQCRFNTDCPGIQKCHKPSGSFTGYCGVLVDEVGMRDPDASRAAQCSFNTDCGVGFTCRKQPGKITGLCTR